MKIFTDYATIYSTIITVCYSSIVISQFIELIITVVKKKKYLKHYKHY